jgi:hypothetical protein
MLNAGSGPAPARRIGRMIREQSWDEVRLEIDPEVKPDVVGSITELGSCFSPRSFDAGGWADLVRCSALAGPHLHADLSAM